MKTNKSIALFGIISLILMLAALPFIGACAAAPAEVIELKFGFHSGPQSITTTDTWIPYARLIEEAAKNKVKVTTYPAATLFKPPDAYDAVLTGVTDIAWVFPGMNPGRFPLQEIVSLPFLGTKDDLMAALMHQHLYDTIPEFRQQFADVKWLAAFGDYPTPIGTKEPVRRLEDLKGLKIRAPGGPPSVWLKSVGATPMLIAPAGIYPNLEKGVIDGWVMAYNGSASYSLQEQTKYFTEAKVYFPPMMVVMNLEKWNSLPPDVQKGIDSISGAAGAKIIGELWSKNTAVNIQLVRDTGREIITLSPEEKARWVALAQPIINEFVAGVNAKGLPGTKVLNEIRKFVKEYK